MSPDARAAMIAAVRASLPRVLVALDFDGTLAPIVVDPTTSRPAAGAIEALTNLSSAGASVAVITGRDARTAVALGGLDAIPRIVVAGLYGAEVWQGGELHSAEQPAAITELRARLPLVVAANAADPDLWIEDKRLSLVVHARRAADPAAAIESVRDAVAALATELGLEVHDGKAVLEIRVPGYDKGTVLLGLVARNEPAAVLFAGDDVGDLPAFAAVRELRAAGHAAWGVAAASAEAPDVAGAADVHVAGPAGVVALLAALTG